MANDKGAGDTMGRQLDFSAFAAVSTNEEGRRAEDATAGDSKGKHPDILGCCTASGCGAAMVAASLDPWDDSATDLRDYDEGPRGAWRCANGHSGWRW